MSLNIERCALIVKKDAIEDGIGDDVLAFVDSQPNIVVASRQLVELTAPDILEVYKYELDDDPSERREILMSMAAIAMAGSNIVAGIIMDNVDSPTEAFQRLNQLKGKTNNREDTNTVRGSFPYRRPDGYEDYSFWFKAPFFIRNRIHVPDSIGALHALEKVLLKKDITPDMLYGRMK